MIYSIKGSVQELNPTSVVVDVNGLGYFVGISLQTSEKLVLGQPTFLHIQQIIREDAHLLFGFNTILEKELFNLLISVNGVGPVSAIIMLSSSRSSFWKYPKPLMQITLLLSLYYLQM